MNTPAKNQAQPSERYPFFRISSTDGGLTVNHRLFRKWAKQQIVLDNGTASKARERLTQK